MTDVPTATDPHAEALVTKMIELTLQGDVTTLRLCMERLISKANRESTGNDFQKDASKLKDDIL